MKGKTVKYPRLRSWYAKWERTLPTLWQVEFAVGMDHGGEETAQITDKDGLEVFMREHLLSYQSQVADSAASFLGCEGFGITPRRKATFIALSNSDLGLGEYASRREVLQKARYVGGLMPCPMDTPFFTLMHTDSLYLGRHIAFPHHTFKFKDKAHMVVLSQPLDWEYLCITEADRKYGDDECRVDWAFMLPDDFFSSPPMLFHQRKPRGGMLLSAMPITAFSSVSINGDGSALVASL